MSEAHRVLLVEDVIEMRELLRVLVDGLAGCRVESAVGTAARARVELLRHRPSLVLLDEVLPGESSMDLMIELSREKIPVILLTGMVKPSHEVPPQALGRLRKPTEDASLGEFEAWKQEFEALMRRAGLNSG